MYRDDRLHRSNLGLVSLGMGIILWLIDILCVLLGIGVLGVSFERMGAGGTNGMEADQYGPFALMIIMGATGLAAIVGFVYGMLGLTTSRRGHGLAIIGVTLNAFCWIWTALFFIFVASEWWG